MSAKGDEDPRSLVELRRELAAGDVAADPAVIPELDRLAQRLTELADEAGTADRETIWSRIETQLGPPPSDEQA
jgi:hypothetical protein